MWPVCVPFSLDLSDLMLLLSSRSRPSGSDFASTFYLLPSTSCLLPSASRLLQYPHRRIPARRAHDSSSGMRRGAAHVELSDRRAVLCPAGRGAQEEQLFERQLPLKDVALGQAPLALEIERRDDLAMKNDVADVRCVLGERVDDRIPELLLMVVPRALFQMVGSVLHEARHDVLARRRDRWIGQAR